MNEQYNASPDRQSPTSGLVVQDADGMWYGWQHVPDGRGNFLPRLVSENGAAMYTPNEAAAYGVPLPAGVMLEPTECTVVREPKQTTQHAQIAATPYIAEKPVKQPSNVQDLPIDTSSQPGGGENGAHLVETFNDPDTSSGLRGLALRGLSKVVGVKRDYSVRQADPDQWMFCDGWGVATASFIRGNDVERERLLHFIMSKSKLLAKVATPFLKSGTGMRATAVVVTKGSPVLVPAEVVTPIPGDEVLTAGLVIAVGIAIAKRRNNIKNGLM